jgi:hypothetical protein
MAVVATNLTEAVLPLIRTRADLHRWSAADEHGRGMHEAVDLLEAAADTEPAGNALAVTQKAITSALTVIARADDSSGIIGDACRRLLDLHPTIAARAEAPVGKLVDWMIKFQFDNPVDYFTIDPVAYAPALGADGVRSYRARLGEIAISLGPPPPEDRRWSGPDAHPRFVLEHNAQRLAVLDRDIEAIIRTHARDRRVARWLHDTAEALAEIGAVDLAIDWAKQAADFDSGHQSRAAADYWCTLLAEHRPAELLDARVTVFDRWPSSGTAAHLYAAAGQDWPDHHDAVLERLGDSPRDAVLFALLTLQDIALAWHLAHNLGLRDNDTWTRLVKQYQKVDPLAVIPVLAGLVEDDLLCSQARNYQIAARRLRTMRQLAAGTAMVGEVDDLVAELRQTHRRRPRLQLEFDRAGLP